MTERNEAVTQLFEGHVRQPAGQRATGDVKAERLFDGLIDLSPREPGLVNEQRSQPVGRGPEMRGPSCSGPGPAGKMPASMHSWTVPSNCAKQLLLRTSSTFLGSPETINASR